MPDDDSTKYSARTPKTMRDVLIDQHEFWTEDQWARLLQCSSPDSALPGITGDVPSALWPALVTAKRMVPTAANVDAYAAAHGVDEHLAEFLIDDEGEKISLQDVDELDAPKRYELLVRILNASSVLEPAQRVWFATQLDPDPKTYLDVEKIEASKDDLFARLLDAKLVSDTLETFQQFLTVGRPAIATAFRASTQAHTFLVPDLVEDPVAVVTLLNDSRVPDATKRKLVGELGVFVPDGTNEGALRAAAEYAYAGRTPLPLLQIQRIAPAVQDDPGLALWQLAATDDTVPPQDMIETLALLGGDYKEFGGTSGHEFRVPVDDSMSTILRRLKTAGRIELPGHASGGRKRVRLV